MKRYRVAYYLSMTFLLIAGLGTGIWLFYFLLTTMILLLLVALTLNLWTFFSFSCKQKLSTARVVKGGSCTLNLTICNNKPFSIVRMHAVVETASPESPSRLHVNLAPKSNAVYDIAIGCAHRGVYEVGLSTIELTDIFGILRMRFDLRRLPQHKMRQLVVYPRLLQIAASPALMSEGAKQEGVGMQRLTEDGESFYDTRQYRFGDPLKRVHRIISARKRELHVKRYDIPAETSAVVAMDTRENGLVGEDRLRYNDIVCECAAALAHYLLRSGYSATLIGSEISEAVVEGKGVQDFPKLYDYLAVMPFDADADIAAALCHDAGRAQDLRVVYVISSRMDQAFTETLSALGQSADYVKLVVPVLNGGAAHSFSGVSIAGVSVSVVTSVEELSFHM